MKFNIRSRCFVALTKPLPVRLTLLPFLLGCPSAWGFSIQSLRTFADNFHRLCMENAGDTLWVVKLAVCACPLIYRGVWPKVWGCLPMTTVVECVCACVCVWFVQTPLARLKRKKGDMRLGCVEQASFHRLPLLISNDLCDSWRSDRRCYWCQLTSLCVFVCACNVRTVACVDQHVNDRTSRRKLHASPSTCRTRAKSTSDQSTFWQAVEAFE